jgi:mannitol/fructose-specific phosphotransferase system IIA component (Ntr-type)
MELSRFIKRERIILDMKSRDRWSALGELLEKVLPAGSPEYENVLKTLRDSESRKCSAVGRCIIIAHAVSSALKDIVVVMGRSRKGISWGAPDGRMVNIMWLFIHPAGKPDRYLELLSQTMKICRRNESWNKLVKASDADGIIEMIARAEERKKPRG